jgi:signal transduction histidine kinase
LLYLLYWYLSINKFSAATFVEATVIFIVGFVASAYLVLIDLLEPKETLDKKLIDITKEMLHEINIPIATIKANAQLLKRALSNQKSIKKVERIEDSSNRLERLYKLLSYSIKKEIMPIESESFDLKDVVKDRVDSFRLISTNKFELNLNNLTIISDKIGLEQAIDNIIENAIKYSPKGSQIDISIEKNSLIIRDYGEGIEPQILVNIYDRYYQSSSENSGLGLGLSIVKEFCQREDIDIKIDSKIDKGTTVVFDFSKKLTQN